MPSGTGTYGDQVGRPTKKSVRQDASELFKKEKSRIADVGFKRAQSKKPKGTPPSSRSYRDSTSERSHQIAVKRKENWLRKPKEKDKPKKVHKKTTRGSDVTPRASFAKTRDKKKIRMERIEKKWDRIEKKDSSGFRKSRRIAMRKRSPSSRKRKEWQEGDD